MTPFQAKIFVVGGVLLAILGFKLSGPSVPNFWQWLILPGLMIAGGIVRLLRK